MCPKTRNIYVYHPNFARDVICFEIFVDLLLAARTILPHLPDVLQDDIGCRMASARIEIGQHQTGFEDSVRRWVEYKI